MSNTTQQFFPITLFGTDFQAPIDDFIRFKDMILLYGKKEPSTANRKIQFTMESDTEPPVPRMELFWDYEYGGFIPGPHDYDQEELERFITPSNFSDATKLSTTIYGLYQDNKPVTATVTVEKHGAEPKIDAVPF